MDVLTTIIKNGGVGALGTDTIFGLSCSASNPAAVDRIYTLKQRPKNMGLIVLAASTYQLKDIGVHISRLQSDVVDAQWQTAPSSIILPVDDEFRYLSGANNTLAVRIPYSRPDLLQLLEATGPLVSTSCNISGQPSLHSLEAIKQVFPDLDFYHGHATGGAPSELFVLQDQQLVVIPRRR